MSENFELRARDELYNAAGGDNPELSAQGEPHESTSNDVERPEDFEKILNYFRKKFDEAIEEEQEGTPKEDAMRGYAYNLARATIELLANDSSGKEEPELRARYGDSWRGGEVGANNEPNNDFLALLKAMKEYEETKGGYRVFSTHQPIP